MRMFQALQASWSASRRASAARSAATRIVVPNRYSRDFVLIAGGCGCSRGPASHDGIGGGSPDRPILRSRSAGSGDHLEAHRPGGGLGVLARLVWLGDDRKPLPVRKPVAGRADVAVALQAGPRAMTRHACYLRDCAAHLEQARDAFVAQIVEMQIIDAEQGAGTGEGGRDRIRRRALEHVV